MIKIIQYSFYVVSPRRRSILAPGLVLSLREGLEAALIIGIVLGTIQKVERGELQQAVWSGTIGAVVVSLVIGTALTLMGSSLEGVPEELFDGTTMFVAAGVLTWAIFWMRSQAGHRRHTLTHGVETAAREGSRWALTSLAFIAVVREGIELSLFLTASALSSGISNTILGALVGILTAAGLGWAAYRRLITLNLRSFFLITGGILVIFTAGLIGHGLQEFIEAGWIPGLISPLWNLDPILPESSVPGQLLKALLGYSSSPSLMEILGYLGYIIIVTLKVIRDSKPDFRQVNRSIS